jgi:hypothetical protein
MNMSNGRDAFDAKAFLDAYRNSYVKGPAAIASFYAEPCVTARMGQVRFNPSHSDTAALFADVDKQYCARGFAHADYELLDARDLGANAAQATARWAYKSTDERMIWQTTFNYNLCRTVEVLANSAADHAR